ncbi:hypothetical protein [Sphingosinicella sp. BN140058]|uniref:hypothetical protein n=1 Tax=Sphingosinicella sp. BN140058 TaxID=1892855 RepID=UPI0013EC0A93|nr:hypothetical protein [Sphingosinicella sp. BN140058]
MAEVVGDFSAKFPARPRSSFTRGPARWFTDVNFGTDVATPIPLCYSRLEILDPDLSL